MAWLTGQAGARWHQAGGIGAAEMHSPRARGPQHRHQLHGPHKGADVFQELQLVAAAPAACCDLESEVLEGDGHEGPSAGGSGGVGVLAAILGGLYVLGGHRAALGGRSALGSIHGCGTRGPGGDPPVSGGGGRRRGGSWPVLSAHRASTCACRCSGALLLCCGTKSLTNNTGQLPAGASTSLASCTPCLPHALGQEGEQSPVTPCPDRRLPPLQTPASAPAPKDRRANLAMSEGEGLENAYCIEVFRRR